MRDFGCRECAALTSGDCGKHGPVTYPLNGLSGGRCLVHVLQGLPCQICASLGPVGRFDEYYLAMAALDIYPVPDDGLPKSTSIIFRIHQLGRSVGAQPVAVSAVDPAVQAPHSPSTRDTTSSSDVSTLSAQWRTDAGNLREQGERIRVAENQRTAAELACLARADRLKGCADELDAALQAGAWHPIETAPRDEVLDFWIVPKTPDESYCDTSGDPIFGTFAPYRHTGKYGSWSSLSKATHWRPLPSAPTETKK